MKKILFLIYLLFIPMQLFAAQDIYQFESSLQQERFQALTSQLRCLVCQNQNLAESNAPLAADLRNQVYQQIRHGQSDQQVIQYLVDRYGDFILYQPPLNATTMMLWSGPFIFLIISIGYFIYYIKKSKRAKK